jgi:hypothetical protein
MRKHAVLLMIVLLGAGELGAGTFVLSFNQSSTDNIFQNKSGEKDHLSLLGYYAETDLSGVSLFAEGRYSHLFRNKTLSYFTQDVGLDYLIPFNNKSALYLSLTGRGAFFRADYADFNNVGLNLRASWKSYLSETSIFRADYSFESKNYRYDVFDSLQHGLLLSLDKYFQTRTTLKGEIKLGHKTFLHPYSSTDIPVDPTPPGGGKGKGKGSGGYFYQSVQQTNDQSGGISVLSLGGLVAQGLGNKIGLSLSARRQWTLSGENPFTFIEEYYMVENPSYDQFSWEGYQLESALSIIFPWDIQFKMGYTWNKKSFPGIENLDLEGNVVGGTRLDKRDMFQLSMVKHLSRFSAFISFAYVDNRSSDMFFQWKGHFLSAGIEWNFNLGGQP